MGKRLAKDLVVSACLLKGQNPQPLAQQNPKAAQGAAHTAAWSVDL